MTVVLLGKNTAQRGNRKCQSEGSIVGEVAKEHVTEQCRSNTGQGKVCRYLKKSIPKAGTVSAKSLRQGWDGLSLALGSHTFGGTLLAL